MSGELEIYLMKKHIFDLEKAARFMFEFMATIDDYHQGTDEYVEDSFKRAKELMKCLTLEK